MGRFYCRSVLIPFFPVILLLLLASFILVSPGSNSTIRYAGKGLNLFHRGQGSKGKQILSQ